MSTKDTNDAMSLEGSVIDDQENQNASKSLGE